MRTFVTAACILTAGILGTVPVAAQSWDPTGNSQLNGTYYFREVVYDVGDSYGDLQAAFTVYGGITFNGRGSYSISTTGTGTSAVAQATLYDASAGQSAGFTGTGTYTIGANGHGFINWTNSVEGISYQIKVLVSNGLLIGSSTENTYGANELFVAAPIASPALTASAFNGSYSLAYLNPAGSITSSSSNTPPIFSAYDALLQLSANGGGTIGTATATGYTGTGQATPFNTSETGVTYTFSGGAAVVKFPTATNNPVKGQEYLYFSPDLNFVFGGSPTGVDMIFGVRTGSAPGFGGLYYQAGLDVDESTAPAANGGYASIDTFFGSLSANNGSIVSHQRVLVGASTPYDYTFADYYSSGGNFTDTDTGVQYIMGNGGVRIGFGQGPFLGISVGLPGPTLTASSGVYLSPVGVVNAASSAPFTASISGGELLTLYGANLAPSTVVASSTPFPTKLGSTQVLFNGTIAAPLYYVSATQVSAIVPYGVTGSIAQIQVVSNNATSNAVTVFVGQTSPGVFTNPVGGLGYAAALHPDYSLVTPKSPAQVGETVAVFVTGLGPVFPGIADGGVGSSAGGQLNQASDMIAVNVDGLAATVTYAGLAPGLAGLYQIDFTVPSGVSTGDVNLDVSGPDSYSSEAAITIGSGGAARQELTGSAIAGPGSASQVKSRKTPRPRAAVRPELAQ